MYKSADPPTGIGRDWSCKSAPLTTRRWKRGGTDPDPVSHSGGEKIRLQVCLTYNPVHESPVRGVLYGEPVECEDPAFMFSSDEQDMYELTKGQNLISVAGSGALGEWPGRRTRTLQWTFVPDDADEISLGTSGRHTVFVTFGPPRKEGEVEDGASVQRMQEATRRIRGIGPCNYPKLLHKLFKTFSGYALEGTSLSQEERAEIQQNPQLEEYMRAVDWPRFLHSAKYGSPERAATLKEQGGAWPLADLERFRGECQAIIFFIRGVVMQVGLPGTIEVKYVTADCNRPGEAIICDSHCAPRGEGEGEYALVDRPVVANRLYGTYDSRVGFNKFEAYMRYRYTRNGQNRQSWYGGGIARNMDEPQNDSPSAEVQQVLLGAFTGIAQYVWRRKNGMLRRKVRRYIPFPWNDQREQGNA